MNVLEHSKVRLPFFYTPCILAILCRGMSICNYIGTTIVSLLFIRDICFDMFLDSKAVVWVGIRCKLTSISISNKSFWLNYQVGLPQEIHMGESDYIYYILYLSNVHGEVCFKLFSLCSWRHAILHCLLKFDIQRCTSKCSLALVR